MRQRPFFQIGGGALKGRGSLAGGEQSEPPEYCNKRMRPGRGAGSSCNPCRGAYRCSSSTRGLASLTPGYFPLAPLGRNSLPYFRNLTPTSPCHVAESTAARGLCSDVLAQNRRLRGHHTTLSI